MLQRVLHVCLRSEMHLRLAWRPVTFPGAEGFEIERARRRKGFSGRHVLFASQADSMTSQPEFPGGTMTF